MTYLVNIPIQKTSDLEGLASVLDLMGFDVVEAAYVGLVAIVVLDTKQEEFDVKQKLRLIAAVVEAPCVSYVLGGKAHEVGPNAKREVDISSSYGINGQRQK